MAHAELELEALLLRVLPQLGSEWVGSPVDEIDRLEDIAERPLPLFYRWFLARMGRSMGSFRYATVDFTAANIIARYKKGLAVRDPQFLLIGHNSDPMMPIHMFYDLDAPARDDARLVSKNASGHTVQVNFETFREHLAWRALMGFRVDAAPVRCQGSFKTDQTDVLAELGPVLDSLGFVRPVATGTFCGLFERADAAMVCSVTPRVRPERLSFFRFGGDNEAVLRKALGTIATEASVEVNVRTWIPPLP